MTRALSKWHSRPQMDITLTIPLTAEGIQSGITELYELEGKLNPTPNVDTPIPYVPVADIVTADATVDITAPDVAALFAASAPAAVSVPTLPTPAAAGAPIPAQAATVPPPPVAVQVDKQGTPWDPAIHSTPPKLTQKGAWRSRRGAAAAGNATPPTKAAVEEVEIKTFQEALGKLIAAGMDITAINTAISQTVFCDLSKTVGGMEYVLKTQDKRLAGKALNAVRAVALQAGLTL